MGVTMKVALSVICCHMSTQGLINDHFGDTKRPMAMSEHISISIGKFDQWQLLEQESHSGHEPSKGCLETCLQSKVKRLR